VTSSTWRIDARILREIDKDDGSGTTQRHFEIGGMAADKCPLPVVTVQASDFPGLGWVVREFGASGIVSAGQATKDRVREAIQRFSRPEVTRVYTHTGWRQIDGKWRFLHAGLADEIGVDLDGSLSRYRLPPYS
jgi:hypothetical protein